VDATEVAIAIAERIPEYRGRKAPAHGLRESPYEWRSSPANSKEASRDHRSQLYQMLRGKTGIAMMLEMDLRSNLQTARIVVVRRYDPKTWRTEGAEAWRSIAEKRRVIKCVERFKPQLEAFCFS